MIWDCFLFNGEFDLLKIRCEELYGLNITHVLIESTYTFTGNKKPLLFRSRIKDFKKYNIEYFIFNAMPNNGNAWDNEKEQRNHILLSLNALGAKWDDHVIISDLDEIPRKKSIEKYKTDMGVAAIVMDVYWYRLNWLAEKQTWKVPRIFPVLKLKENTPDEIRRNGYPSELKNGGWHFSYQGDEDFIIRKLESFSHTEYNLPEYKDINYLKSRINNGIPIWGSGKFEKVDIDESYPLYIFNNKEEFKHLIA